MYLHYIVDPNNKRILKRRILYMFDAIKINSRGQIADMYISHKVVDTVDVDLYLNNLTTVTCFDKFVTENMQ